MKILNFITSMLVGLFSSLSCASSVLMNPEELNFDIPQKLNTQLENKLIEEHYELNLKITEEKKCISEYLSKADLLIIQAKSYLGTPYRYGGTTRKGIDCSAFVKSSYSILDIDLERVSSAQALQGERIPLEKARKGDLLFFAQSGNKISHVAIVERVNDNEGVFFIHASSSKGVTISSLNDEYWSKRYRKAVRIVE